MDVLIGTSKVFISCCVNVVLLELIIRLDPGSANVITFSQFLFISIHGVIYTSKFGKVKPVVPLREYATLVFLYFIVSVANNYALSLHIPVPLHMIFKSGSLVASLVMGMVVLKKKYSMSRYIAIAMITIGVIISTLASKSGGSHLSSFQAGSSKEYYYWLIGVVLLISSLLLSARMGIHQEIMHKKFGKHPSEALFYIHALSLPGFVLLSSDIRNHFNVLANTKMISLLGISCPIAILYLFGNMVTQYYCSRSVFNLIHHSSSLTVTLVVTLRKFISLLFSIYYFKNPFTFYHWIGTILVFMGTFIFTEVWNTCDKNTSKTKDS